MTTLAQLSDTLLPATGLSGSRRRKELRHPGSVNASYCPAASIHVSFLCDGSGEQLPQVPALHYSSMNCHTINLGHLPSLPLSVIPAQQAHDDSLYLHTACIQDYRLQFRICRLQADLIAFPKESLESHTLSINEGNNHLSDCRILP